MGKSTINGGLLEGTGGSFQLMSANDVDIKTTKRYAHCHHSHITEKKHHLDFIPVPGINPMSSSYVPSGYVKIAIENGDL